MYKISVYIYILYYIYMACVFQNFQGSGSPFLFCRQNFESCKDGQASSIPETLHFTAFDSL